MSSAQFEPVCKASTFEFVYQISNPQLLWGVLYALNISEIVYKTCIPFVILTIHPSINPPAVPLTVSLGRGVHRPLHLMW